MFARATTIALAATIALAVVLAQGACERTDHESIDTWQTSRKGPGKLREALASERIDADLSAHAAVNLVKAGREAEVRAALERMSTRRREAVVARLATRLWELARIEGERQLPAPSQVAAKDQLAMIRAFADPDTVARIDGYLIDWYATPAFEGRATAGAVTGVAVIRMVGAGAARKLVRVAEALAGAPGPGEAQNRIGDELLRALAVTGDPRAVALVLDLARQERGDPTLRARAIAALHAAFVEPAGTVAVAPPAALAAHIDALAALASSERTPGTAATAALALIRLAGPPACLRALVSAVAHPHPDPDARYIAPSEAVRCGGIQAIEEVARAMPSAAYDHRRLRTTVVQAISSLTPRDRVLSELRSLLGAPGRMGRWLAVEGLAAMASVDDAPRIARVRGPERLEGFWGGERGRADPTLSERARALAAELQAAPR